MNNGIEIYLRHSGDRTLMMFHVPADMREQFLLAMQGDTLDGREVPIAFEAPILPQWIRDPEAPEHMRVAVDQISIQFDDE